MTSLTEQPSLANERERRRDSFRHGYIPPKQLVIDPSITFDHDAERDLDVVTYEVIRSKLWNLNVDHGDTIRRVSGSNIVVEGYDFNTAVTTEMGDAVTFSPYSMFFAGFADEIVKWTLEHRSMNVGIHDGRHLHPGRPVGRVEPSDGHRRVRTAVPRRQAVRLAVQLRASTGDRRQAARRLHPRCRRCLHRTDVHATDQAGRKRGGPGGPGRRLDPTVPPARADGPRAQLTGGRFQHGQKPAGPAARALRARCGQRHHVQDDRRHRPGRQLPLHPAARRRLARRALRLGRQSRRSPALPLGHDLREKGRPPARIQSGHGPRGRRHQRHLGRVPGFGAQRPAPDHRLRPVPLRRRGAPAGRLRIRAGSDQFGVPPVRRLHLPRVGGDHQPGPGAGIEDGERLRRDVHARLCLFDVSHHVHQLGDVDQPGRVRGRRRHLGHVRRRCRRLQPSRRDRLRWRPPGGGQPLLRRGEARAVHPVPVFVSGASFPTLEVTASGGAG